MSIDATVRGAAALGAGSDGTSLSNKASLDDVLAGIEQSECLRDVDILATAVGADRTVSAASRRVAAAYGVDIERVVSEEVAGRPGDVVRVPVVPPSTGPVLPWRWVLVGVGAATPQDLRRAGAALAGAARGRTALAVDLRLRTGRAAAAGTRALVEGLLLAGHSPPTAHTRDRSGRAGVSRIELLGPADPEALALGALHARTGSLSRDLAFTPASVKSPAWLAEQARQVAERSGLDIEIWDGDRLGAEGFGGLLAVGSGSRTPPRLVRLSHRPTRRRGRAAPPPVVLVGKGITFDTGGLSLKPREAMVPMKTDMSGAGAVLAVLAACRDADVGVPVTALLPLAENMIGAGSYRPGDVVRHYGGRTVEVTNTDAEGRLVLADALAFADARLEPSVLVDVATLTGAATAGLGKRHAALYSADDALARDLIDAGRASGERLWRMPLVEDYRPWLHSDVADLRQMSRHPAAGAGSVLAALFLREFAGSRRWAHLDIAGPARSERAQHETPKGPTGFGARMLLRWLEGLG